ncbi:DivIVA domain-containing protein [Selenomonas sp. oral taxon 892]|jgi:cell division protein divIVA|uniref:DivIVA domain-containing protein n=1 Tax=Selenomonas sp. oral taxon 892 TaxID=1321785 RepID=UPI0003AD0E9C|nr:DivIVA domain-containing protein [Selenomonas sp. oral taxon 892]ERJ95485.1 putative septum site-determining protein divIVA [Selenomonas sp. oral taxon 892 str. F0426]
MLTPMDIHAKEFGRSFRGFDETEVNDFLNEIMKAYAAVLDENEQLRAELAREQAASDEFRRIEQSMRETLIVAQKTAEEVTANAKRNADQMLETAAKEAQNLKREATLQAKAQVDDAADRVRGIVAEYERLVREKHQFLRRMKGNVQAELALIEDAIAQMPDMAVEKNASRTKDNVKQGEEDI